MLHSALVLLCFWRNGRITFISGCWLAVDIKVAIALINNIVYTILCMYLSLDVNACVRIHTCLEIYLKIALRDME